MDYWSDYLIGFFLDSNPPYHVVISHCNMVWKPHGGLCVHFDNSVYFFKFARCDERLRILEADPIIIDGSLSLLRLGIHLQTKLRLRCHLFQYKHISLTSLLFNGQYSI